MLLTSLTGVQLFTEVKDFPLFMSLDVYYGSQKKTSL